MDSGLTENIACPYCSHHTAIKKHKHWSIGAIVCDSCWEKEIRSKVENQEGHSKNRHSNQQNKLNSEWLESIPFLFKEAKWQNLNHETQRKLLAVIGLEYHCWLFYGNHGSGKSYSGCSLLREFSFKGMTVYYDTAHHFISCYLEDKKVLEQRKRADVLLLDEITHASSSIAKEIIYELLDYRYREKKQTIIIGNLNYQEIPYKLGKGIADRYYKGLILFDGASYRRD